MTLTTFFSDIDITTTAGTSFEGTTYFASSLPDSPGPTFFYPVDGTAPHLGEAGARSPSLFFFPSPLTNAGGTVNLLTLAGPNAGSRENLCDAPFADCSGAAGIRGFLAGAAIIGTPISVPEPGTAALLEIGLAGIGLARRRRRQRTSPGAMAGRAAGGRAVADERRADRAAVPAATIPCLRSCGAKKRPAARGRRSSRRRPCGLSLRSCTRTACRTRCGHY